MSIKDEKTYLVRVNRTVQVGRLWLRPGTQPQLLGSVAKQLGDAVTVLREV